MYELLMRTIVCINVSLFILFKVFNVIFLLGILFSTLLDRLKCSLGLLQAPL